MLPNVAPLWEIMLAVIKLGAVISPATTLLSSADLQDRIERGEMRHVIADAPSAAKLAAVPGDYTRIVVEGEVPGWRPFAEAYAAPAAFEPDGPTLADDPFLLYFTSGTTAKPKMVLHTHQSYPVGHLSTLYWIGLREGDVHLNISSPGWAKHAWSCFFAPWNAGATIFIHQLAALRRPKTLDDTGALRRHHPLRAADGLADADPGGSEVLSRQAPRAGERRRAAQPRGDRSGARGLGADRARRLRPDRDHLPDRQFARRGGQGGRHGQAPAGLCHRPPRRRRPRRRRRGDLPPAQSPSAAADGRLPRQPRGQRRPPGR